MILLLALIFSCSKIEQSNNSTFRANNILRDVNCNISYLDSPNIHKIASAFTKITKEAGNIGQFKEITLENNVSKAKLFSSSKDLLKEEKGNGNNITFNFMDRKTGVYFIEYTVESTTKRIEFIHFSSKLPFDAITSSDEGITIKIKGEINSKDLFKRRVDILEVFAKDITVHSVIKKRVEYSINKDKNSEEKYIKVNRKDLLDECKKMNKKAYLYVTFKEFVTWNGIEHLCEVTDKILINENI